MFAKKRKMLPAVVLIVIGLTLGACRDKSLVWDGTVKGDYKLEDDRYGKPKTTIASGSGAVKLYTGLVDHLRLGKDTPIPDCTFVVRSVSANGKYEISYTAADEPKAHTGEVDDGKGCVGRIDGDGPTVPIQINRSTISLKDDGTVFVSINYGPKREPESYSERYAYERMTPAEQAAVSEAHAASVREFTLNGARSWF